MTVQESVFKFRDCKTVEELSAAVIAAKAEANKIEDQGLRFSTHEQIDFVAKQEVVRLIPVLGIGAWPIEKVRADIQNSLSSELVSIGPGHPDPLPPPPTKALPSEEQRRKDFDAWWATQDTKDFPAAWKKQGPAFMLKAWEKAVELYGWGPDRLALLNLKKALREVVRDYTDTLSKGPAPISVETAMAFIQGIHIDFEKRLEALT